MPDEFIYKPQDVHYLGFLEAQLRDMQGIHTLAYELIQNADDALENAQGRPAAAGRPTAATTLRFHVNDDALIVENDGVFRAVDYERLQTIASGGKREESGVTGAFGLGFLAVYQVTDRPEILSNGRHWTIFPEAPAEQRIVERQAETSGTRFRLPWAFDPQTAVRRSLRLSTIQPAQLDTIAAELSAAIGLAALFLQQIHVLEVTRSGALLRRVTRRKEPDGRIILQEANGDTAVWLLFDGDFTAAAEKLRTQYPWQIEATRRSAVTMALPTAELIGPGRLFAGLPTASTIPLSLHINADFFPTTDRKRIHFDEGYQSAWNQAAITCAAQTLAAHLPALPGILGPAAFWRLMQQIDFSRQQAEQADLPAVFAAFWQAIAPQFRQLPLLYTAQETWALPADVRLWTAVARRHSPNTSSEETAALLAALKIPIIHAQLVAYLSLLRRPEIGAPELTIRDITDALIRLGLNQPTPLYAAPPFLRRLEAWQTLWALLQELINELVQPDAREAALNQLRPCALALTDNMILERLPRVYRGSAESQALFPAVAWLHPLAPAEAFPSRYISQFGARQAVDLLAETPPEQLQADWQHGQLDLPRLFRWLEAQQIEIFADDRTLPAQIRRLPLCPVDGELRPLANLYLPGGFTDPLRLAGLVDLAALGGRRQFLEDLGVPQLDFSAYIYDVAPRVLAANPDVPTDARHELVQLLAQRLGEFQDEDDLQERYHHLPLIACLDGSYRPAAEVYLLRTAVALLGEQIHVAEPVESKAVQALYRWLGVREQPAPADLVTALLAIAHRHAGVPLDAPTLGRVQEIWQRLADLPPTAVTTHELLRPLLNQKAIPNGRHVLTAPDRLFLADQPELAARFRALPNPAAQDCLLALPEKMAAITAVVGVRPLSQMAALYVHTGGQPEPAPALAAHLRERAPLIRRLLHAETADEPAPPTADWLETVQVYRAERLEVAYHLPLSPKEALSTAPEAAAAKLVMGTAVLYVTDDEEHALWTAVGRELAQALRPNRPPGALALGVKEVLSASTFSDAAQILRELGYN